ncbi:cell division protein DedD [Vibrio rotiferianus]|jgi:dCMP deaminase|uniref:Cell division protein DedD n=1 Tax=Vibrio rotiferianus TaxID=190895 RepID=A0A2K7SS40_9VIBR|nr:cytidine/deoxycytidylate deaminase family protein [Vibrio rotiferianus]ASI94799.1 cell division protein DedD [Vibrio rotiferianus]OHY91025.1 cell division protein DedD [Vibrio rotiferianus]PIB11484.1 deoxycytidylate deaminase [Vibrio rotiferianus CAIM 577 = LMG 21460]TMX42866.1 cell division protein DedD [Vibrio rotiferianus]TMX59323.1 cell division protein DedD [Vibrio rotiferianus]
MISKWEKRFYQMAELVASWSKDPSTQVGAVITKQNRIVSVGFNGYPHGVSDSVDTDERELKYLKTLHAEENAILFSKRDLDGCEIWVTHFPCPNCAAKIIQTGISRVSCPEQSEDFLSRWGDKIQVSQDMFNQAGVEVNWLPINEIEEKSVR